MNPERWQKIELIFQTAIDLTSAERQIFLQEQCQEDLQLKSEVEKLLADSENAHSFIESPVWTDSRFLNSSAKKVISDSLEEESKEFEHETLIGTQIGVYRLTKEIGRGGMGAVFLAERADGEFSQTVAIKLIKRGMDTDFIVRRFRHERQILATIEHPFIARLLDGGTTSEGMPYFVMEFIEGETIYNYCDNHRLNLTERLKIFQKICSAVEYAHEQKIIHRDIKPSNILVTRHNEPKLLDFGIAKVLDPDLIHESVNPTASMMRLMTPDYASPEQVRGLEVTPSSDIYSLGILLYELLTGHRPYNFAGRALHEVSQVICEVAPKLPSKIIAKEENLLPQYSGLNGVFAKVRSTSPSDLQKQLSQNLDNIVMKALAKETSERYSSVKEFSDDIARHLRGQNIEAKPFTQNSKLTNLPLQTPTAMKSLAVLPFKFLNLVKTEETGDKFLGVGLADALITRLSKVRSFVVRPTSSILPFNENLSDPIQSGKQLGVDFILDGNIKKANDRLRVTIQLLNVAENSTIWATSIDEVLADVFTLEDTLSNKVIEALLPQLTGSEREEISKRGTEIPEAFEHYLRGRYYFNTFTEDGLAKAFVEFHNAISSDPNYSHAYTGIADYYIWLGIIGVLPPLECFQPAIKSATKAVEIDDKSSKAHATLGFALHAGNYDWGKAEHHLTRAIELNPNNATAYVWYSIVLFTEGRFSEGLEMARRGISLDPLTPFNQHNLGWGFYFARRYEEAEKQYKKVVQDFPNYVFGPYGLSKIYRITGKTSQALDEAIKAKHLFSNAIFSLIGEAECFAADGQTDTAHEKLRELEELSKNRYVSPYQLALIYSFLQNKEKTLEKLNEAFSIKEAWLNWLGIEPAFDFVRDEKEFQTILEKTGYEIFFNNFSASRNGFLSSSLNTSDIGNDQSTQNLKASNLHNHTTLPLEARENTGETTVQTENVKASKSRKKMWLIAAVASFVVVFGLVFALYSAGILTLSVSPSQNPQVIGNPKISGTSVVVLPFKSENAEEKNLGIGLADDLTRKLGNVKKLVVISANSGRMVEKETIPNIGEQLGTSFVVRATLNKSGENANISAEMIDTQTERVMWNETFSTSDGNLFALQTKLAEKIWTSLGIEPLPVEREQIYKDYTKSSLAYELYLLGRYQMTNRSSEDLKKAISAFNQALEEDANFALAFVGLADAHVLLSLYEINPPKDAYQRAEQAALKALSIDDNLAQAHTSLGYIKFFHKRDQAGAELEFRRAIQINPSYAQAHHWFALALMALGRATEAISEMQTAELLNPRAPIINTASCMAHYYAEKYDEATVECDQALAINESFVPAHKTKRWIYSINKNYAEALSAFRKEYSFSGGNDSEPGWNIVRAQIEAINGNHDKVRTELEKNVENPLIKNNPFAFAEEIALAYNALGDKEKTLEWLEKAEAVNNHKFNYVNAEPRFANLRNEPRFQAIVKKLKNEK